MTPRIETLESRIAPAFGGTFQLTDLNGSNGFKMSGEAAGDYAGTSVSAAGDLNGDGIGDLIVGAPLVDGQNGAAYVVFGRETGFTTPINLGALDGVTGFKLAGETDSVAGEVSAAGDVNGDGVDDLIIGAPAASASGPISGAAYVIFGHQSPFPATLDLGSVSGASGFKIQGALSFDQLGSAVAGAGDVNGDGFDDVIVGTDDADPNGIDSGAAYVIFGRAAPFATPVDVTTLNGANGFKFFGTNEYDSAGRAVSGAGDVNGDGFSDLLIGAFGSNGYHGETYVIFGKSGNFTATYDRSTLNGTNGFSIQGDSVESYSGHEVNSAGDVNGDGFDDIIIGALEDDPTGGTGPAYVVFGRATGGAALALASLNGTNGFKIAGTAATDNTSPAVAGAGDVNGDGFDDLLIGTAYSRAQFSSLIKTGTGTGLGLLERGATYVVFGKAENFEAELDLATLDAEGGVKIQGEASGDQFGIAVSAAGDVNGDGVADFLSGARFADPNGEKSGAVYVIFGQAEPLPTLGIGDISAAEGQSGTTPFSFPITLSESSATSVSVLVSTDNGSATAGSDFTALTNELVVFAPGETSKSVTVMVTGDTFLEEDESFIIVLSNPSNATIADGTGLGTIRNDDVGLTLSVSDAVGLERQTGSSFQTFAVTLSEATTSAVSVLFSTASGTATGGSDFTPITNQTIQFAPGETTKLVTVNVFGDATIETNETFFAVLSSPSKASIADGTATGIIINDDVAAPIPGSLAFTDADGDSVVVTLSNGRLESGDLHFTPAAGGFVFEKIDLIGSGATGAILKVAAVPSSGGDGKINVGLIDATGMNLAKVKVTGDLTAFVGGSNDFSVPALGTLKVSSLGVAQASFPGVTARFAVQGGVDSLKVEGDIVEVVGNVSGSRVRVNALEVGGDILGSSLTFGRSVGSVSVAGNIQDTVISSGKAIGSLVVGGSILDSDVLARRAFGDSFPLTAEVAIVIQGDLVRSQILAGYDSATPGVNSDATIGTIVVGGNLEASSIAAGVAAGVDMLFGTSDDILLNLGFIRSIAKITAINIKGTVLGTAAETDGFGIVAEELGKLKIGGVVQPLATGPRNDLDPRFLGGTNDVRAREVPLTPA